ncbi:unnamed protein product [Mytilus coruscus]|uniref:Uncharacterized protein n=1 Tax=Mytilus coruscus TaxID=42192 RepID=A0A6J8C4F3_MYTCO|nr:unnamed protein product [Mytilus coruscus]
MKSLYADDNGVWKTSSPKSYIRVSLERGKIKSVEIDNVVNMVNSTHFIRRQYGTHQATVIAKGLSFQRIISSVTSKNNQRSRYAVVQYIRRDCVEDDIVLKPHGNARKQKNPFFKTETSVLDEMKTDAQTKPKRLFTTLVGKACGPLHTPSASSEPRNLKQIYNARASQKQMTDELVHSFAQLDEDSFVRNFFKDSGFVDTCFENLKVVHTSGTYRGRYPLEMGPAHTSGTYRGRYPLEMGPVCVHTHRDTMNYANFFDGLKKMNSELKHIQAIGTDGDIAIRNAVVSCYESIVHLLCADHKRGNIESKLSELRPSKAAAKHISSDIFGRNTGSLYESDLKDSEDTKEFDRSVRDLKATWDWLVPTFYTWFIANETDLFKSHLIKAKTIKHMWKAAFQTI